MNEFIEKNRQLLKFYCTAARIFGWVLLCGGTIWFLMFVLLTLAVDDAAGEIGWPHTLDNFVYSISSYVYEFAMLGLVALLVAQLIRYMLEIKYTPGHILRFGDKILYIYAAFLPLIVPMAAKVLILVGLGQILRRILNVLEESKTLV